MSEAPAAPMLEVVICTDNNAETLDDVHGDSEMRVLFLAGAVSW